MMNTYKLASHDYDDIGEGDEGGGEGGVTAKAGTERWGGAGVGLG